MNFIFETNAKNRHEEISERRIFDKRIKRRSIHSWIIYFRFIFISFLLWRKISHVSAVVVVTRKILIFALLLLLILFTALGHGSMGVFVRECWGSLRVSSNRVCGAQCALYANTALYVYQINLTAFNLSLNSWFVYALRCLHLCGYWLGSMKPHVDGSVREVAVEHPHTP